MNVIQHYDRLVDENNDPFYDPPVLQKYMDKWDGKVFIDSMLLNNTKQVLEIGVGTGRLAKKVAPNCLSFVGIDISHKTIERAKDNLHNFNNVTLICADYVQYDFKQRFDVVYSSLTLMHFEDKQYFISKACSLLVCGGLFCLSIDKNQEDYIYMADYKIKVFPDTLEHILSLIKTTQLCVKKIIEKEFAHIIICQKR